MPAPNMGPTQDAKTSLRVRMSSMSREELLLIHSQAVDFLQEVRLRINALPCIHQLPVELLTDIFRYAIDSPCTSLHNTSIFRKVDNAPLLTLIRITHVCRRWRAIATDASFLWGRIHNLPNESLVKLFMERSRTAPLTVTVVVKNKGRKLLDSVFTTCSARLRTLHVFDARTSYARHPPLHQRPLQQLLPDLQCCVIVSRSERRDRFGWPSSAGSGSMPFIFSRRISTLRALAITPVAWLPGNSFPSLSHLFLSFSMHAGTTLIEHLRRLLSLLSNAPNLGCLQLTDVGQARESYGAINPFTPSPPAPSSNNEHKPILLLRLRSIIVTESGRIVLPFLECLDMPEDVMVRLSGMDMHVGNLGTPRLPHLPPMNRASHMELSAIKRTLHLVAGPAEAHASSRPPGGLWLQATYPEHAGNDWKAWLADHPPGSPFASLSTLHICFRDPELYPALLQHTTRLVELGVHFSDATKSVWEPCLKILCALLGRRDNPCCPKLRVLCIETRVPPEAMSCYSRIVDVAVVRAQQGRPLRRVAVRANLPWRPWEDPRAGGPFAAVFGRLGEYVEEVEYRGPWEEPLCSFDMHQRWRRMDVEAEKYWEVEPRERGEKRYTLPFCCQ
ncbi:hypothetical protein C8Q76DRAFT_803725 [Earliella scabrosa]|nr:hypothetical protein C8Q76DRAFT_803725 [Earliella scabrosa]